MSELQKIEILHCGSPGLCGNFFDSSALLLAGTRFCRRQHLLVHDVHRKPSLTFPNRMWRKCTAAIIISVIDNFLVSNFEGIYFALRYWCLVLTDQDGNTCTPLEGIHQLQFISFPRRVIGFVAMGGWRLYCASIAIFIQNRAGERKWTRQEKICSVEISNLGIRQKYFETYFTRANTNLKFSGSVFNYEGKAVPLQAWSGPEGSRKLRFPDFMTTAHEGGKVVSLTHRPHLPPRNSPGTHFC